MNAVIKPFGLRLPPELKQWLCNKARINGRSMNSELVQRLDQSRKLDERATVQS